MSRAMGGPATASDFERALSDEIFASEILRLSALAATLAAVLVGVEVLLFVYLDTVTPLSRQPFSPWLPLQLFGPYLAYECAALIALRWWRRRGGAVITPLRFVNAAIETSLPSVLLWTI